jgi:Ca2+-transporting ATPase
MAFLALGTTQLAVAAGSRVRPGTLANPALPAAITVALALQLAALYVPFLRDLLHTQPLPLTELLIVGALSCLGYAAIRLDRIVHRDKPADAPGSRSRSRRPAAGTLSGASPPGAIGTRG